MVNLWKRTGSARDLAVAQLYHHHLEAGSLTLVLARDFSGTFFELNLPEGVQGTSYCSQIVTVPPLLKSHGRLPPPD